MWGVPRVRVEFAPDAKSTRVFVMSEGREGAAEVDISRAVRRVTVEADVDRGMTVAAIDCILTGGEAVEATLKKLTLHPLVDERVGLVGLDGTMLDLIALPSEPGRLHYMVGDPEALRRSFDEEPTGRVRRYLRDLKAGLTR